MNSQINSTNSQDTLENPSTTTVTLTSKPVPFKMDFPSLLDLTPISIPLFGLQIKRDETPGTSIFSWNSLRPFSTSGFDINFNYMIYNTMVRGCYNFELLFKFFKIPGSQVTLAWKQFYHDQRNSVSDFKTSSENAIDNGVWMLDDQVEFSKDIMMPWNGLTTPLQIPIAEHQFPQYSGMVTSLWNIPEVGFQLTIETPYVPNSLQPDVIDFQTYVILKPFDVKDFLMGSYQHVTLANNYRYIPEP